MGIFFIRALVAGTLAWVGGDPRVPTDQRPCLQGEAMAADTIEDTVTGIAARLKQDPALREVCRPTVERVEQELCAQRGQGQLLYDRAQNHLRLLEVMHDLDDRDGVNLHLCAEHRLRREFASLQPDHPLNNHRLVKIEEELDELVLDCAAASDPTQDVCGVRPARKPAGAPSSEEGGGVPSLEVGEESTTGGAPPAQVEEPGVEERTLEGPGESKKAPLSGSKKPGETWVRPRTIGGVLTLAGGGEFLSVPTGAVLLVFSGGLLGPNWRVDLIGRTRLGSRLRVVEGEFNEVFELKMWGIGGRGCYVYRTEHVELPVCGGAEGGQVFIDSEGDQLFIDSVGSETGRSILPWILLSASVGGTFPINQWVAFALSLEIGVTPKEGTLKGGDSDVNFEIKVLKNPSLRVLLGLEVRIPGRKRPRTPSVH